ncbi:ABC transporter substrate-binding protein [Pseudactinotalea terrae]|uniref:ABC transporter substrate-binding protein n=1 Tax=Pseudactinotalea terrae TaxID=1743262 RepID=UPI0012E2B462|nr:ABC transporter substrate-binding protein [Pseudactinotalea terrae]
MSLKRLATATAAALLATTLVACADGGGGATDGEGLTTVRVGYIPGAHDIAQLFVADEAGYFEEQGIELEVTSFQTGITLSQALTGGSLDVGVMGAVVANFPAKGQGHVIVLNNQQVDIHQIWASPESGITSIDDLAGATIATTSGTASDVVLQVALDKAGLTRADVEVVNLEMPAVTNTFVTGGVEVASLWAPFDSQVEENMPEAVLVATAADLDAPISGGWVASNDFYDNHMDLVQGMVRAWQGANADIVADPEAALDVFCPRIEENMDAEQCHNLYGKTEAYSNEEWATFYADGTVLGWIETMQSTFEQIGALEGADLEPADYVDTTTFADVLDD